MKKPIFKTEDIKSELWFEKGRVYQRNCFNLKSFAAGIMFGMILFLIILEIILH
jgi:hypothetical protein